MAETTKNDTVVYQDETGEYESARGVVAFSPRSAVLVLLADGDETGSWVDWPGGEGVFAVEGTWGGATASLEFSLDGGSTAIPAGSESELTADGGVSFRLPDCKIRCAIADAGTTSLNASAKRG